MPVQSGRISSHDEPPSAALTLAEWRRQTAELYRDVRHLDGAARAHAVWRAGRDRMFSTHPQSPLAAEDPLRATGLPYWPYDRRFRFVVELAAVGEAARYEVQTAPTEVTHIRQLGWVQLPEPISGRLAVWWLEQYGGGIFIPFRDATAGTSTYGAGRYLLDTAKGADLGLEAGRLVLDFNFSYHPSCRYDPQWQCPLAPPENRLTALIEAGERLRADGP